MKKYPALIPVFLMVVFLTACAENGMIKKKYDTGLNSLTYDEVLSQMLPEFGKPASELKSFGGGALKVTFGRMTGPNSQSVDVLLPASFDTHKLDGEEYIFTFDAQKKILRYYYYIKYAGGNLAGYAYGGDEKYVPKPDTQYESSVPASAGAPPAGAEASGGAASANDALEQKLNDLKQSYGAGLMTKEEYLKAKKKVLNGF